MQSNIKEFTRINNIAHAKILVSEDSSVYHLFAERREVCKKLTVIYKEELNIENYIAYLEKIEDNIKLYLCL